MCEYYGLPLALIFEELVDMDKPEDKAQEQRPEGTEQGQQSKGTANNQPPPLCLCLDQPAASLRPPAASMPLSCIWWCVFPSRLKRLQRPLGGFYGLVRVFRSMRYPAAVRGSYFLHSRSIGKAPTTHEKSE